MKNKLSKILSSLLIISFLMSAFAVFAFAEDSEEDSDEGKSEYFKLLYNRDFEEGWDYNNGFAGQSQNTNTKKIDYEEDNLRNYNYFIRYEALANTGECQTRIDFEADATSLANKNDVLGSVIELSVKSDDLARLGKILWFRTAVKQQYITLLSVNDDDEIMVLPDLLNAPSTIGKITDEWLDLAFVFDWTKDDLTFTLYVGKDADGKYINSYDYSAAYTATGDIGILNLYFGFSGTRAVSGAESVGMSICFDNIKVYTGTNKITEFGDDEYGERINPLADKVIEIKESAYVKSKSQVIEEALAMKVGVDNALIRNIKYSLVGNADNALYGGLYGAPVKQGDNVLVPLQLILDYIGFPSYTHPDGQSFDITTGTSKTYITLGRSSATVDGERVELSTAPGYIKNSDGKDYLTISLSDVPVLFPGWLAIYDDMGLILIYEDTTPEDLEDNAPIVNRHDDLDTMVNTMKKFVFDFSENITSAGVIAENGTKVYNDVKENTDNFKHPYLVANADTFATLKAAYAEAKDATLKAYIDKVIADADAIYAENANTSGDAYVSLKDGMAPVNPYADGNPYIPALGADNERNKDDTFDGYDTAGQLPIVVEFAEYLPTLAFAYQMTGSEKYARMAYDWAFALSKWTHWAPGYMQDCAEATAAFAIGYDWLYNAYISLGLDTAPLADAIFNLGVHDGYNASFGISCQHARSLGDMSVYNTKKDGQNAIGTSGMVIGALAILDYIKTPELDEAYYNETISLLGDNLANLFLNGLDVYAPDGSYMESALHWERATSNFVRMSMALDTAAGTDYGFMSTWGIDKSCYYAIHIESSDGVIWNYHEGGADGVTSGELASLNTDMFNFVAKYLDDPNLYAVRRDQIAAGKTATLYDVLFYPLGGMPEKAELKLDYFMEGIDAFVSRSDFTEGSMYTGLMGGGNNGKGGQLDSGNFIYHNKGIVWVMDLGSENPNIAEYSNTSQRYKFYRASAEGQNVVMITTNENNLLMAEKDRANGKYGNYSKIKYGQYDASGGKIARTFENEFGSYAILDNKDAYFSFANYARRGILVTNNRETVVLQDEIAFNIVETATWVLHTATNIKLDESSNNRVAYLSQRGADGNDYTLRATLVSQRPDFTFSLQDANKSLVSTTAKYNGTNSEYSRDDIKRLVIEATTISFDLAVVFEIIDTENETPVQYTWTQMSDWEPVESSEVEETVKTRPEADKMDIKTATERAETILKKKDAFTKKLDDLYRYLTLVTYTLKTYPSDTLDSVLASAYGDYLDCVDDYEKFLEYAEESHDANYSITKSLTGIRFEEIEVDEDEE